MRRAVFLDRDGVINALVYDPELGLVDSPASPEQFRLLPSAASSVRAIHEMGLLAIIVSNQPGVAKGRFTAALLEQTTRRMEAALASEGARLDAVYYCLHHPEAACEPYRLACDCRKPKPGLLVKAARDWQLDLRGSYLVGDGIPDVQAGRAAGCATILLGRPKCDLCRELDERGARPDGIAADLGDAVRQIAAWESDLGRRRGSEAPADGRFTARYLREAAQILERLDQNAIEQVVELVVAARERGGRVFFLGVGGGAANAAHAVNDFRKIAGVEAYAPSDNVSELTARTNDEGWDSVFVGWLKGSRLSPADLVFVFSVGGGSLERNISANIVRALDYARQTGAAICGVVGRDGGYTAKVADAAVVVPVVSAETVTPHTESLQALIAHLLVSHPRVKAGETKWESVRAVAAAAR